MELNYLNIQKPLHVLIPKVYRSFTHQLYIAFPYEENAIIFVAFGYFAIQYFLGGFQPITIIAIKYYWYHAM